jgi:hypothetical protein
MLITMRKHVGLHILDEVVKKLVKMGLDVYVMKESRPFKIAAFGVNASRIQKSFGMDSISKNTDFFQKNKQSFVSAHVYLNEGLPVISG